MRLHDVSLLVADVITVALGVLDAQQLALSRADADGVDAQAVLGRFLGRRHGAGVVVLAVGEQDEDLVVVAFFVGGERGLNGFGNSRPALGDGVHVESLDALAEGRVVNGKRALQERAARKGDEPEAVRLRALHQVQRGQLGPRQAVGRDVLRQHAFRGVYGNHDVQPTLLDFLPIKAPLRPRQRQDEADDGEDQAAQTYLLSRGRNADGQRRQEPCLDELGEQALPHAGRPPEEGRQGGRNDQQQPEHLWVGEGHLEKG